MINFIYPPLYKHFWFNLLTLFLLNSGQFTAVLFFLALFNEQPHYYYLYGASIIHILLSALLLRKQHSKPLVENLFAFFIASAGSLMFFGPTAFYSNIFILFAAFTIMAGILQEFQTKAVPWVAGTLIFFENFSKSFIIFGLIKTQNLKTPADLDLSFQRFFLTPFDYCLFALCLTFGLIFFFYQFLLYTYSRQLNSTTSKVNQYSFMLTCNGIEKALHQTTAQTKCRLKEYTIVSCKISNFIRWSTYALPHDVLLLLNQLYPKIEAIALNYRLIKIRLDGHTITLIFEEPELALEAAYQISKKSQALLCNSSLNFQFGIVTGPVFSGFLGTGFFKYFDVFGVPLASANEISAFANPGEILLGESAYKLLKNQPPLLKKSFKVQAQDIFLWPSR